MIKDLSYKLRELRLSQNLSQSDVAKKLKLSPSIVSGYETGERTPSTENLLALSYLYKCSTDYLLGKSNEKPSFVLDTDGLDANQIKVLQDLIRVMKHE
jgi:transcriptional regulator with XRE-family HTH domain